MIVRVQYLSRELARRQQDRQTETMVGLTKTVTGCTLGMALMTLVIMFLTALQLGRAH